MEEAVLKMLSQLPTAGVLFYIWYVTNNSYIKERDQWRKEIVAMNNVIQALTNTINKLTYILENYVTNERSNPPKGGY